MTGRLLLALAVLGLAACGGKPEAPAARAGLYPNETPELRGLIEGYARSYGVPPDLVQRVVIRESRHVPSARNGPYYGLMQIHPQTAQTMGYQGRPDGLLDAEDESQIRGQVPARRLARVRRRPRRGSRLVREGLLLRGEAQGAARGDRPALGQSAPSASVAASASGRSGWPAQAAATSPDHCRAAFASSASISSPSG